MNELKEDFLAEKEQVEEVLRELKKALKSDPKKVIEIAGTATFIHNVYNGVENILKRTLKFIKVEVPNTESFHKDLLSFSVENKIIKEETLEELDKYRAFRHFFIHGYSIELDKDQLIPLAENLILVWDKFESEIKQYIDSLG